ncbi:unnamed protein product [Prorocentrum cordatum]|uniref:Pentacotripeptide-repeat region of PRORP domain-containing protein n=1 Tax=Prorocentrum cordatum TaxID=2364126 RepID=A0ABN9T3J3_9DINO|nr:unnamed protein product [Polarella glacialis]
MCLLGASDFGMAPNGKSYGCAIRACTAVRRDKAALTLFDCMEKEGINPNRFAYHDAILSCVRLRKLTKARSLYENMQRDGVPPCDNTLGLLIRTCTARGLHKEAEGLVRDFSRAKSAEQGGPLHGGPAELGCVLAARAASS